MTADSTALVSPRAAGRSVVMYRMGGREYPMKTVASCQTCNSPFRFEIEEAIVGGTVYRKIAEQIAMNGEQYAVSSRSMQDHFLRGHMPMEMTDTRETIEERARKVGKSVEDGNEALVDGITLLQVVIQKSFGRIIKGEADPSVRDGMAAAKLLAELGEYDGSNVDQQSFVDAFMVYHEEAERIMDPEAFAAFGAALEANPVLKALASRYEGEPIDAPSWEEGEEPPPEAKEPEPEPVKKKAAKKPKKKPTDGDA